jgi:flagellar protein FliO/FliZ
MGWFFLILILLVAVAAAWLAWRSYVTGEPVLGAFLGPRPEKRLSVVEQTSVDNRRKLLLVRRDGVEHLLMTGGPVDVVIETNIGAPGGSGVAQRPPAKSPGADDAEPTGGSSPVFGRAARKLGQVVNE